MTKVKVRKRNLKSKIRALIDVQGIHESSKVPFNTQLMGRIRTTPHLLQEYLHLNSEVCDNVKLNDRRNITDGVKIR